MELFRLLAGEHGDGDPSPATKPADTTIAATVLCSDSDDGGGDSEDEGPFFDLELTPPMQEDTDHHRENQQSSDAETEDEDGAEEFDLELSPDGGRYGRGGGSLRRDPDLSLSPSDGLFFKGRLVPLEPSSLTDFAASEVAKSSKSQVPALLKSAARARAFKLSFHRRSKSASMEPNPVSSPAATSSPPKQKHRNKFFVRFRVEAAPPVPLFARDNSSRSSSSSRSAMLFANDGWPASDDKKLLKDVLQRYLSKIKPFYIKISKRYVEKLRFSGPLSSSRAMKVRPAKESGGDQLKETVSTWSSFSGSLKSQDENIPAGLRVVSRRLRKSRSASAAVASVRSPPLATGRRDDSLLEQQDGIQSAIAHCKRSFNRGTYKASESGHVLKHRVDSACRVGVAADAIKERFRRREIVGIKQQQQ
ncbi:unnamed protein product [Musa acuminata subsp. burmannicoides]